MKQVGTRPRDQKISVTHEELYTRITAAVQETVRRIAANLGLMIYGGGLPMPEDPEGATLSDPEGAAYAQGVKAGLAMALNMLSVQLQQFDACLDCEDRYCIDEAMEAQGQAVGHGKPNAILQ
jgi:hypothetical protein